MPKNFMATMGIALTLVITPLVSTPAVAQNVAPASVSSTANSMMNLNTSLVATSKKSSAKTVYKYTTANLNMRSGIGTKHKVVKVLKKGTKVSVKSTSKGWSKVSSGNKTGWVSGKYLTTKAPKPVGNSKIQKKAQPKYSKNSLQGRAKSYLKSFGCANVPVTWVNSNRFNGQVDLSRQTMKLNKKMPAYRLKYVTAHECHHIKQARAYKGDWDRMFRDVKRAHPGVSKMTALERNADCATRRLGIKEWNYTKNCSAKQKAAAKRIWEGKRAY